MAGELQVAYDTTGANLYFLVRNSVAQVWNGAAFETYVTASLSSYAIAAAEQGVAGRYYTATFPAAAAGIYYTLAKLRAGGSPAESDLVVGAGIMQWSGTAAMGLTDVPTAAQQSAIASVLLKRDLSLDEASAAVHSLLSAALKLVAKFSLNQANNTATTTRTDGSTTHMVQSITKNVALVPVQTIGLAS